MLATWITQLGMDIITWLVVIALSTPFKTTGPYAARESSESRQARISTIMEAIVIEAKEILPERYEELSVAEYVITREESGNWDPRIHSGEKHPDPMWHQDHGKAKCIAQLHSSPRLIPKPIWRSLVGTDLDSTRRCINFSMRILVSAMKICGVYKYGFTEYSLSMGFAHYASGHSCKPTIQSRSRARSYTNIMARKPSLNVNSANKIVSNK